MQPYNQCLPGRHLLNLVNLNSQFPGLMGFRGLNANSRVCPRWHIELEVPSHKGYTHVVWENTPLPTRRAMPSLTPGQWKQTLCPAAAAEQLHGGVYAGGDVAEQQETDYGQRQHCGQTYKHNDKAKNQTQKRVYLMIPWM